MNPHNITSNYTKNESQQDKHQNQEDIDPNLILSPTVKDISQWNKQAETEAKKLKDIKTHQLRKAYETIVKIKYQLRKKKIHDILKDEQKIKKELLMFKVRLAYTTARKKELKKFYKDISELINNLLEDTGEGFVKKLENFCDFFEAIIAFHKHVAKRGDKD